MTRVGSPYGTAVSLEDRKAPASRNTTLTASKTSELDASASADVKNLNPFAGRMPEAVC